MASDALEKDRAQLHAEKPELPPEERRAILDRDLAMWRATAASIDAGTFTKAEWLEHLRAERDLAEREISIDLEGILVQGFKLGFIVELDEAWALLDAPAAAGG